MLTHITNFVIHVTKFVTNFFCADNENYQAGSKNLLGDSENYLADNENYLGHSEVRPLRDCARSDGLSQLSDGFEPQTRHYSNASYTNK